MEKSRIISPETERVKFAEIKAMAKGAVFSLDLLQKEIKSEKAKGLVLTGPVIEKMISEMKWSFEKKFRNNFQTSRGQVL